MENINEKISDIIKVLSEDKVYIGQVSLISGDLSIILFHLHAFEYTKDWQLFEKAIEKLKVLLDNIVIEDISPTYCTGLAGLGLLVEYIEQKGWVEMDTNDILGDIDEYLYLKMMELIKIGNHDFLHGAVGIGFYFIYRSRKTEIAKKYLENFVIELKNQSQIEKNGNIKWEEFDFEKNVSVHNEYNLGLSHGIPAILSFLLKVHQEGILSDKTSLLIQSTTRFIISKKLDQSKNHFSFPNIYNESKEPKSSRLAWCYGDLGVCCVLWQVAKLTKDHLLKQDIIKIMLLATSKRDVLSTNIVDAGLCHGSSGAAHIFQRFYDWTNEEAFEAASAYWYQITLNMAVYENDYVDYKSYTLQNNGNSKPNLGFLEGMSGIGLALLYKISGIDPSWEELLFIR